MTDVCYIVSFGFAARMVLQTGLIHKLVEEGKTVAIITPDPEDPNLQQFANIAAVRIYPAEVPRDIWQEDYLFKRKYYLEDIKANPALWEKHVYSLWYSTSKHPWRRVRPLYYLLIHHLIKVFPGIRQRFLKRESRYLASDKMRKLLAIIQPKLLTATYPVNILEAQLLYESRAAGIPTSLHLLSWDNITSKGRFPALADYYLVWGNVMRKELQQYYNVADEKIHLCGVPHFDHHIAHKDGNGHEEILGQLGLSPNAPYLFFAMSAQRFSPYEIEIVENLASAVENNQLGPDIQLILRPHPQNVQGNMASGSWLQRLAQLQSKRVAVDTPRLHKSKMRWSLQQDDMTYLAQLLAGCSVCLNSGSTISIEAMLLDKPVILTSFDADQELPYWKSARRLIDYTHLAKLIAMGGISVVKSTAEMLTLIQTYLDDSQHLISARKASVQEQCNNQDGKATERVVSAIQDILRVIKRKHTGKS